MRPPAIFRRGPRWCLAGARIYLDVVDHMDIGGGIPAGKEDDVALSKTALVGLYDTITPSGHVSPATCGMVVAVCGVSPQLCKCHLYALLL